MRLADFVIKFLEEKKIDTVFTVSGGGSIFLCDALYKSKKLNSPFNNFLLKSSASFSLITSLAFSKRDFISPIPKSLLRLLSGIYCGSLTCRRLLESEPQQRVWPASPIPVGRVGVGDWQ